MKKQLYLLLLVLIGTAAPALGQVMRTVRGQVTDATTQEPLAGVTVVSDTERGTTTDPEGRYALTLDAGATQLTFNYVGYQARQVALMAAEVYDMELQAGVALNEVVVTALGLERSSQELGYAVQQLRNEQISSIKAVNFLDNLNGKLAGVSITAGSSGIGATTKISIRGESSFTYNNPLFVVDGVPINNHTIVNITNDAAAGFQEVDFGNGAMDIHPDDIASVSVLKGPAAAALYGTRAFNGVVVINTRDGSQRQGFGISFNTTNYVEQPFTLPDYQDLYGQGNSGRFEYKDGLGGGINDNITYSYGPRLDAGLLIPQYDSPVKLPNGQTVRGGDVAVHGGLPITPTPFVARPDNVRDFYETGLTTMNNLAFSGGYERGHYRVSLSQLHGNSIIPGVDYQRRSAFANLHFNPFPQLKFSTSIYYINSGSRNRPGTKYGSENINYDLTAWLGRQTDLEPLRNYWQPGLEGVQQYSYNYTFFDNPYFTLLENRNGFGKDRLFGHVRAEWQVSPSLSVQLRSGMDQADELRTFRRAFSSNRFRNGGYAEHQVDYREINTDLLLNYRRAAGSLTFDISLGGNRMDQHAGTAQTQALSLAQPGVFRLSNAASPLEIFEYRQHKRINSVYGLAKIGIGDFLFVDITGRNDWSSALATPTSTANTSFFYPSASASLIVSRLLSLPTTISFAKLRANWGQVGNDTDPYRTTGTFVARTPFLGQPTFGDQDVLPNANLLPEQLTSTEVGADIRFFDDRLSFDLTVYEASAKNQILTLPIALSSGYNQQVVNGGEVRNRGVEAVVGIMPLHTRNLRWQTYVNFSRNVATVESLPGEATRLTLAYNRIYDNPNQTVWFQVREGDRIGDMWGTGYLRNENGDFVIGNDGRYIANNSLIKLGNYNPDFTLGFFNQLQYRNFGLSFLIDWRQGGVLVSRTLALAGVAGQLIETADRPEAGIVAEGVVNAGTAAEPRWVPNTKAIPAETYYRQYYDRNHEENNTYDASYIKLRELSLRYRVPATSLRGSFLRYFAGINIAVVGRNLLALSDMRHFDPEQLAIQGQTFVQGVEDMSYPTTRSFGISLGLDF